MRVAGGVKPDSLSTRGLSWGSLKDTQFMETSGTACNEAGEKGCIWDIRCGRVASVGTFCQVHVKMSKHTTESNGPGTYEPQEFTLRFPDKPILDAHWSNVWTDSFKQAVKEIVEEPKKETLAADLSLGVEVLRLAQICG